MAPSQGIGGPFGWRENGMGQPQGTCVCCLDSPDLAGSPGSVPAGDHAKKIQKRFLTPASGLRYKGFLQALSNEKVFIFNMFHTCTRHARLAVLGIIPRDSEKNKRFQLSTPVEKAVDNFRLALEAD